MMTSDFRVGTIIETRPHLLTGAAIAAYADASGDYNPLHLDPAFASTTQFGRRIAHGMLLVGLLGHTLTKAFGESWQAHSTLHVRFRAPAFIDDSVIARVTVQESSASDTVACSLACLNQHGETIVTGDITVHIDHR